MLHINCVLQLTADTFLDYVWIHPETGEITCWINNLPDPWSFAGNNKGVIGSGVGPSKTIFLAVRRSSEKIHDGCNFS